MNVAGDLKDLKGNGEYQGVPGFSLCGELSLVYSAVGALTPEPCLLWVQPVR